MQALLDSRQIAAELVSSEPDRAALQVSSEDRDEAESVVAKLRDGESIRRDGQRATFDDFVLDVAIASCILEYEIRAERETWEIYAGAGTYLERVAAGTTYWSSHR